MDGTNLAHEPKRAAQEAGVDFPAYPPMGSLSIEGIARSKYLFA
jgi:hypothetical protein